MKTTTRGESPLSATACSPFEEVSDKWDKESGGERHIRRLSERFWVSVLHRLTGFGYWEWETAIVIVRDDNDPKKYARGKWDDRECLIVRGDHRETLADKSERGIIEWYAEHSGERNSMETLLAAISENDELRRAPKTPTNPTNSDLHDEN